MLNKILSTGLVAISLSLATACAPTAQQDQNTSQAPSGTTQPVQTTETTSPTTSPTTSSPSTTGQNNLSSADRTFMTQAAQGGLAEVQLGQLASQRGASNEVKQYGQRMVQDHTQANSQLQQLAQQKGVTLPKSLNKEHQQVQQQLTKLSGRNFDRQYMSHMVQDHEKTVALFQQEAQEGQDAEVKAFATQTLPILQDHLQQAQSLANPGGATSTPTPGTTP
ncbi:outer membrane protein [Nostoc carneum NIES-2107]|nr:outer membrane protein [Nostoc carneum NIES-2107]